MPTFFRGRDRKINFELSASIGMVLIEELIRKRGCMITMLDKLILLGMVAKDLALFALSMGALIAIWRSSSAANQNT